MEQLNIVTAVLGGLILIVGLISKSLERSLFPPTVLALALGIVIGPQVLNWVDLSDLGDRNRIVEAATRLTLAIGLIGVALRVPRAFPRSHWRNLTWLIGGSMIAMWAISTGLIHLLLPQPFWLSALIGAIVTATDPIAASPIVTGPEAERFIPERLRHTLSFESGANDGLSYLFVFLPFLLVSRGGADGWRHWLLDTVLIDVVLATAAGLMIGWGAGRALMAAEARRQILKEWRLVHTVALALLAAGAGRLVGSDELLVAFAAGCAFVQVVSQDDRENEEQGQEAVNRFFAIPIFTLLGVALPWEGWFDLGGRGLLLAVAVILLRRPPVLWMLSRVLPSLRRPADVWFVGWFGPVAVAAMYYAVVMEHHLNQKVIWDVVSLIVVVSVVLHGMTAAPFTRWYARVTGTWEAASGSSSRPAAR